MYKILIKQPHTRRVLFEPYMVEKAVDNYRLFESTLSKSRCTVHAETIYGLRLHKSGIYPELSEDYNVNEIALPSPRKKSII